MLLRLGDMRRVCVSWGSRCGSAPGLRPAQRGLCGSSAVRAIVDQVAAAVEDKPRPATRRHQRLTVFGGYVGTLGRHYLQWHLCTL